MKLEVPIEKLREHKLFVATPMYGGMCTGTYTKASNDLVRVCTQLGIECHIHYIFNESLIQRARNYLADEFLRSPATKLMFIDADIDFNPMDVLALAALDKDIIGAPYPKKCIAWERVADAVKLKMADTNPGILERYIGDYVFNPAPGVQQIKIDEPTEVLETGTGFLMIDRKAFEKWQAFYPDKMYKPDHNRSEHFNGTRKIGLFFDCIVDPQTERYLSEDYYFCQTARQAGMQVWLCPWMELKHTGTFIFGGSLRDLAHLDAVKQGRIPPDAVNPVASVTSGISEGNPEPRYVTPEAPTPGMTRQERREMKKFQKRLEKKNRLAAIRQQVAQNPHMGMDSHTATALSQDNPELLPDEADDDDIEEPSVMGGGAAAQILAESTELPERPADVVSTATLGNDNPANS